MALPADFSKIYGSTATGGLTPIGDVNYAKGWEFVGSNPPTKNDFSYLQNLSDLKSQWLYSNKLQRTDPFGDIKSDGKLAVAAALSNLGLGEAAKRAVGTGGNQIPDMSYFAKSDSPQRGWTALPNGHIHQYGVVTLGAVGTFNPQTFGGVTYYTRYYVVTLPRAYPAAHQVTTVTISGKAFNDQGGVYGLWAMCNRNVDSSGPSLTSFTVSVTTVDSTQVPIIHFSSEGY